MADISSLSGLAPVEQIDLDIYPVNQKKSFRLPEAGSYTLQAPAEFPAGAFGVSASGALTVQIDPTIVGPAYDGYTLRYTKVSAKVFKRNDGLASQLGDYLVSCGIKGIPLSTPQEQADAAELTAGRTYQADLDWRAFKDGFKVEGMKNFPRLEDGTYQSWVNHPTLKNEKGEPVRVFANLTIRNFIPAEG